MQARLLADVTASSVSTNIVGALASTGGAAATEAAPHVFQVAFAGFSNSLSDHNLSVLVALMLQVSLLQVSLLQVSSLHAHHVLNVYKVHQISFQC